MERQFQAELQGQQWHPDLASDGNNINKNINNNNNNNGYMHMSHQSNGSTLSPLINGNAAPFSLTADSTLTMSNGPYGSSIGGGPSGGQVNLMLMQKPWMMSNIGMESSSQGILIKTYLTLSYCVSLFELYHDLLNLDLIKISSRHYLADHTAILWQQQQQQQHQPMYPQQHYTEYAQVDVNVTLQQEQFELPQQHQQFPNHSTYFIMTAEV